VCPDKNGCATGRNVGSVIITQGNKGEESPGSTIAARSTLRCGESTPTTISKDANGNIVGQTINNGKTYNCNWSVGSTNTNPTVTAQDENSAAGNAASSLELRITIVGVIVGIWMALM